MLSIIKKSFFVIALLTTYLSPSYALNNDQNHDEAEHHHHKKQHTSGVEALTPALKALLNKEMLAIQDGMMNIIPAYASGDWEKVADIGTKMEQSYILKQSLTKAQIDELHHSLPKSFIKQDQDFHYFAGMLSHAAHVEKPELVGFYFSKLSESCINCHSQHATHKFPTLNNKERSHHSH